MKTHKPFMIQICQAVATVVVAGLVVSRIATMYTPSYTPSYTKLAEAAVISYNQNNIGALDELNSTGRNFK